MSCTVHSAKELSRPLASKKGSLITSLGAARIWSLWNASVKHFIPMWFRAVSVQCHPSLCRWLNYIAFSVIIVVCHIVSGERVSIIVLPSCTHYIASQYTINQEIIDSKSVTKLKVNTNVPGGCYRRPKNKQVSENSYHIARSVYRNMRRTIIAKRKT